MPSNLLQKTLDAFDTANACDPTTDIDQDQDIARELLYGQRMSKELTLLIQTPSEHLQLAARAQHIERWKSPRTDYPEGRSGYKKWRSQLYLFHAQRAGEIMQTQGYNNEDIDRVRYLIQKRQMKTDLESQTLEDTVCLVFLRYYFEAFAAKHTEEKLIGIIQKTWNKMSENGHQAALKINFSAQTLNLLQKSLKELSL